MQPRSGFLRLFVLSLLPMLGPGSALADAGARRPSPDNRLTGRLSLAPEVMVDTTSVILLSPLGGLVNGWVEPRVVGGADSGVGAVAGGGCTGSELVTHTDANFSGGQFVLQQGFAEDEIFAAQYSVPAGHYPITIRQINFIIAQDSSVETTTHYTLFIWDGPPGGGANSIEIAQFNSMEDLAPVVMAGGAPAGTDVQVVIDSGDPDQIVISDLSGTGTFSIGVRIDQHNNPPDDPCAPTAETLTTNAFPATDNSGLSSPTGNWVFALDCLAGLCPSGWSTFSQLPPLLCRPTGDWIMKATYECAVELVFGACCTPTGECLDNVANTVCNQFGAGATFFEGMDCPEVVCPEATGACCAFDTCLLNQTPTECDAFSGAYVGDGTDCSTSPCNAGACCMPDGSCDELIEIDCLASGGTFDGVDTLCVDADCPQPLGACCFGEVCVSDQPQASCEVSGVWLGAFSTCDGFPCSGPLCPAATILSSTPSSGTVDARPPFMSEAPLPRLGIGSAAEPIIIELGQAGAEECFVLCETASDPLLGSNSIQEVVDVGGGDYQITLDHAIPAGAVTTITYDQDASFVTFIAHPANVDSGESSSAADVVAMVDALDELFEPPHGDYGVDLDRSGAIGPEDLLRLLDLLNGAGELDAWFDTDLPTNPSCPE